jgi:hypothetical protein
VIPALTNREAGRLLAQAEAARRAEIDAYWALCQTDPDEAARAAVGADPVMLDLLCLARIAVAPPAPDKIAGLAEATERLTAVRAIRAALVDALWEERTVVALKVVDGVQVLVLRYVSQLFNPATIPASGLTGGANWHVVLEGDGDVEFLTAYVIGTVDADGRWQEPHLDAAARSALMRDLKAMEALVDRGRLGEDGHPLPAFPSGSDASIARLKAHQAALRSAGAISAAQQAIVDARTAPLQRRVARLRRHMQKVDDALYRLRCEIVAVAARALEEETGFMRGDAVRHRVTNDAGILEIVDFGSGAQFRLRGTDMYVTEDIRRGEWIKAQGASGSPPAAPAYR